MIKEKLKYFRKLNNLRQVDIAKYLNITKSCYANYEQGKGGELKVSQIIKLCNLYLITPNELLGYDDYN